MITGIWRKEWNPPLQITELLNVCMGIGSQDQDSYQMVGCDLNVYKPFTSYYVHEVLFGFKYISVFVEIDKELYHIMTEKTLEYGCSEVQIQTDNCRKVATILSEWPESFIETPLEAFIESDIADYMFNNMSMDESFLLDYFSTKNKHTVERKGSLQNILDLYSIKSIPTIVNKINMMITDKVSKPNTGIHQKLKKLNESLPIYHINESFMDGHIENSDVTLESTLFSRWAEFIKKFFPDEISLVVDLDRYGKPKDCRFEGSDFYDRKFISQLVMVMFSKYKLTPWFIKRIKSSPSEIHIQKVGGMLIKITFKSPDCLCVHNADFGLLKICSWLHNVSSLSRSAVLTYY